MEIKINKEICEYKEALFFGLSARQFLCSVLAVALAAGIYFGLKGIIGRETASWLCMVAAAPIAAMGFFRYNGLTAEKLLFAIIKSEILYAKRRVYKADNYYLDLLNMEPGKAGGNGGISGRFDRTGRAHDVCAFDRRAYGGRPGTA